MRVVNWVIFSNYETRNTAAIVPRNLRERHSLLGGWVELLGMKGIITLLLPSVQYGMPSRQQAAEQAWLTYHTTPPVCQGLRVNMLDPDKGKRASRFVVVGGVLYNSRLAGS